MSKSKFLHTLSESKNIFALEHKAVVLSFVINVAFLLGHPLVDTSMLLIQWLLNAVKSRVGIRYHSKVDNLFEFLKTQPSWTDFGEAIVDSMRLPGSNVHDYLFHNWRKLSKKSPPQGLDKLIRILFQNDFDPQNVMNRD